MRGDWLPFRKFVSQFFGLLVVVLAGLFFQDLDLAIKTMEPFYHLPKAEGANRFTQGRRSKWGTNVIG